VGQVAALREVQSEHRVAGLEEREVHRGICLRTRVGLHVGVLGAEQLLRAVYGELLHLVHEFAATVVALCGKTFGVLVGKRRAHRLEDRFGDEILAGDELQAVALSLDLAPDHISDVRIVLAQHRHLKPRVLLNSLHLPPRLPPRRQS
jgi:hypothetical protein